ncbi:MAG: sodium-translocating pyrophosphatase [Candidatus Thorarchaeota archaeon]|nr:sodium-translocating pyrophosphatase [Candidatus Thorarchaeota archaeon]
MQGGIFDTFLYHFTLLEKGMLLFVIAAAIISLIYAHWLWKGVKARDKGTEQMQFVWNAIREGALSYLQKQLRSIIPTLIVLTIFLFLSVYIVPPTPEATEVFGNDPQYTSLVIAVGRTIAFILGASFSLIVGQLGMRIAVESSVRVAQATREGGNRRNRALEIAYHGGTFTGMLTDGLGLLGGTSIFIVFGLAAPDALLGFGLGGTLLALFMRVGGGIYTKAADVGADLVGKVEQGLPEDDPRNAAVIADLVGDNVGDCAGMAADIFESYEVTIVSSLILGLAIYTLEGGLGHAAMFWIVFPLVIRAVGVISSMVGTFMVAVWKTENAEHAMFMSYEVSSLITIITAFAISIFYAGDWRLGALIATGVMLAVSFNPITSYFTSTEKAPVKEIVKSADTGTATVILQGLSSGYESTVAALMAIVGSFVIAMALFAGAEFVYVLYAISLVGIGMLSHTGNNVAMDSYGPISDNANGIGELSPGDFDKDARQIMADLDAVGNTTKAITKGVAIASAVIAAVSLFNSYIVDITRISGATVSLLLSDPMVFTGLLIGGAIPWLFSALNIKAVSRAAGQMVQEVRRQFRIPGILEGTKKPDYGRAVAISTAAAQKELVSLAVMTISIPLIVGILLNVNALGGFLAGVILSGQLLAVFMANTGGAWDNAKKTIEDEPSDPANNRGKGSARHKSSVVGDTIGDPLKDTAGPALNPMIKVINLLSLIVAPILVQYQFGSDMVMNLLLLGGALILMLITAWAIRKSRAPAEFAAPIDEESIETTH